ncbi:glycosyltransferase [Mesorhizobium sp. NBSH29]|uniref:glycosyltransferase n=1 Tax=Mesorhizobium sp. NBSH29 TaxID=2654249 RepID=UPI0018969E90|nr:glycosyltransferase [Mesorhizobium sp. NBSH29]
MLKFKMPKRATVEEVSLQKFDLNKQYACTVQRNFGVEHGAKLYNEIFDDGEPIEVVWQPDTYHEAKEYLQKAGCVRVIDVGCGSALKLRDLFSGSEATTVIAIDFAASLRAARENFPAAQHIECDLSSWEEVLMTAAALQSDAPTVILCADVIEHLPDPRPALMLIRMLLETSPLNRAFISTPDRSDLRYGSKDTVPANPTHIREWTLKELSETMAAAGFFLNRAGKIRANPFDNRKTTILVECSFAPKVYSTVLARLGLSGEEGPTTVMLTTEYPGLVVSGGIGTFVANWQKSHPGSAVMTSFPVAGAVRPRNITTPWLLEDMSLIDELDTPEVLLSAIFQLLFYCPHLREIHYQDYLGIGFRIAQAKTSGLLPSSLTLVAHCHGNQHYLENACEGWGGPGVDMHSVREKISVELADGVIFPSAFLKALYETSGIAVSEKQSRIVPYRYDSINHAKVDYSGAKRLVFIGKFNAMKGFDLFCDAFDDKFCRQAKATGIEEVVLIGRGAFEESVVGSAIRNHFHLDVHTNFDHEKLVSFIRDNAADSIFVEPYRGDNFPLAVYDVVATGGILIAGRAGGIPEMFDDPKWNSCTFELTPKALQAKILEVIGWQPSFKQTLCSSLIQCIIINNRSSAKISYRGVTDQLKLTMPSCTVMIPFYNTKPSEIADLFHALNHQALSPDEVLIINDASDEESAATLKRLADLHLALPFRIIDHQANQGLAAARNTAVSHCNTDIILNADSDDVPLNDWVKSIALAFARNPDAGAAVPYLQGFEDGSEFNLYRPRGRHIYRPHGDGYVFSQTRNELGHANAGYRVATVRAMGGWGYESKAKYEDWAFYLNLIARGGKIVVIPSVTCLYRVRKNSMTRTYSEWPGQMRLYQTTGGLSRFEALQLQRLARNGNATLHVLQLEQEIAKLRNRKVVKMADRAAAILRRNPALFKIVKTAVATVFNAATFFKQRSS